MSGALLFGIFSVVAVVDLLIAMRFHAIANRADSEMGAPPRLDSEGEVNNPETLRRVANLLMYTAPLMWLAAAALSFGLIPIDGITPIKF